MSEPFAHPVISIIVEHSTLVGHVLLQRRTKAEPAPLARLFELPQGRLRQGESLADCARRELSEETASKIFVTSTHCAVDRSHRDVGDY
jgi:8-oxo-dGTP pyrophosphatase MutT (NUDIX family)